jgi:hypothetical protein
MKQSNMNKYDTLLASIEWSVAYSYGPWYCGHFQYPFDYDPIEYCMDARVGSIW